MRNVIIAVVLTTAIARLDNGLTTVFASDRVPTAVRAGSIGGLGSVVETVVYTVT
ncbi:MAG: hypothetical protein H7244_02395 [Herminiimonas sp.]|nr:hypothetical protein [Herminiimonas sp.]